ncbi:MAG: hypothetical protein ACYDCC_13420 [Actinomycetota bacterium]
MEWTGTVMQCVPSVFESYARIHSSTPEGGFGIGFEELGRLLGILGRHTATPEIAWFGLWSGYRRMELPPGALLYSSPTVERPFREYLIYRGDLRDGTAFFEPPLSNVPDLMWPDDRSWFVTGDTDLDYLLIGSTQTCIDDIASDAGLQVTPVELSDRLSNLMINPY